MRAAVLVTMAALLASCSGPPEQPGDVTADEARQLDRAADMLDANSVSTEAIAAEGRRAQ